MSVVAGVVIAVLGRSRKAFKYFRLGVLKFPCALYDSPLQFRRVRRYLEVQVSGVQQIVDSEERLGRVERLGKKVRCASGKGAAHGFSARIGRKNQDGEKVVGAVLRSQSRHDRVAVHPWHHEVQQY